MTRRRELLALELLAQAAIVTALVVLLTRLLHIATFFDEGVYLVSLDDLRHGEALGRDVFTSQGPGFYVLLQGIGWIFPVTVTGIRLGMISFVALGAVFAYLLGRRMAGPAGGLLCAGLISVAPLLPQYAALIFADAPAMILAVAALWLVVARRPALGGAAFAAAVLIKVTAFTGLPSLLALLLLQRPAGRSLARWAVGAAAVGALFSIAYRNDLGALWSDAVSYHLEARKVAGLPNWPSYSQWFTHAAVTPYMWLLVVSLVLLGLEWRTVWPLWLWPVCTTAFYLTQQPLRPNHVLVLPYAFGVPIAITIAVALRRLPARALPVAALGFVLLFAAGWIQELHRTRIGRDPEDPSIVAAAHRLAELTHPGDVVVSDQPIMAFLAGRRVPGPLVDTASLRFDTGSLTEADVLRAIDDDPAVTAAVVGRAFAAQPGLVPRIRRRFLHALPTPAGTIYYGRR